MKEARGFNKNKKGQVTVFIIIALVVVVLGIAIYFLLPKVQSSSNNMSENPYTYFQNCLQNDLRTDVKNISLQGGSLNPSPSYTYNGNKIQYLCYTNKYYAKCTPQEALLITNIQNQIKQNLNSKVQSCFTNMRSDFEKKGYTVTMNEGQFNVMLVKDKVVLHSNTTLTLTKGSTSKYNSFDVSVNNNLYELASLAKSIVSWEQTYGDSSPSYFMAYYPKFEVQKKLQDDGTKIYLLTDRTTNDTFEFAARSVVLPPGVAA